MTLRHNHRIPHEHLHAMQFRAAAVPQVRRGQPAQRSFLIDRECPLDTASDRCLWHAGGTAGESRLLERREDLVVQELTVGVPHGGFRPAVVLYQRSAHSPKFTLPAAGST
jgi:hypothetical protein